MEKVNDGTLFTISKRIRHELTTILSGSPFHDDAMVEKVHGMSDAQVELEYKRLKNIDNDIYYFN